MAAARRSSESKALVFMIVFLLLAVAAICTTVAFYQKYANLKKSVARTRPPSRPAWARSSSRTAGRWTRTTRP